MIKQCRVCLIERTTNEFAVQRHSKDGRESICKPCRARQERERRARETDAAYERRLTRLRRRTELGISKRDTRKYRYGLTQDEYDAMLHQQGYLCAICQRPNPTNIDHDHACCPNQSGKTCGNCVRGVLCAPCNFLLGAVKDDPAVLQQAIAYLGEHSAK